MILDKVVGHDKVKSDLFTAAASGTLPHAILLSGAQGCGSLPLAIALAQFLLCETPADSGACGTCNACVKSGKLSHPDLHFTYPVGGTASGSTPATSATYLEEWREQVLSNPYFSFADWVKKIEIENKQAIINKAESDYLLKVNALKSFESSRKVFVVWLPEKMNATAANRLLKTLEEPVPGTYFILVTESVSEVMETIRSRTQLHTLPPLSFDIIQHALQHIGYDEQLSVNAAILGNGNMYDALQACTEVDDDLDLMADFQSWMRNLYGAKVPLLLDWADTFHQRGREYQKQFLNYSLKLVQQCLMLNYGDDALVHLAEKDFGFLRKFAPFIHASNSVDIIALLNKAASDVERNANGKILMADLSFQVARLLRVKNVNL